MVRYRSSYAASAQSYPLGRTYVSGPYFDDDVELDTGASRRTAALSMATFEDAADIANRSRRTDVDLMKSINEKLVGGVYGLPYDYAYKRSRSVSPFTRAVTPEHTRRARSLSPAREVVINLGEESTAPASRAHYTRPYYYSRYYRDYDPYSSYSGYDYDYSPLRYYGTGHLYSKPYSAYSSYYNLPSTSWSSLYSPSSYYDYSSYYPYSGRYGRSAYDYRYNYEPVSHRYRTRSSLAYPGLWGTGRSGGWVHSEADDYLRRGSVYRYY